MVREQTIQRFHFKKKNQFEKMAQLLDLPKEVLRVDLLSFCSGLDLLEATRVNRLFHTLIDATQPLIPRECTPTIFRNKQHHLALHARKIRFHRYLWFARRLWILEHRLKFQSWWEQRIERLTSGWPSLDGTPSLFSVFHSLHLHVSQEATIRDHPRLPEGMQLAFQFATSLTVDGVAQTISHEDKPTMTLTCSFVPFDVMTIGDKLASLRNMYPDIFGVCCNYFSKIIVTLHVGTDAEMVISGTLPNNFLSLVSRVDEILALFGLEWNDWKFGNLCGLQTHHLTPQGLAYFAELTPEARVQLMPSFKWMPEPLVAVGSMMTEQGNWSNFLEVFA